MEPAGSREKYKQPQTKARHLGENKINRNTNTNINTEKIKIFLNRSYSGMVHGRLNALLAEEGLEKVFKLN